MISAKHKLEKYTVENQPSSARARDARTRMTREKSIRKNYVPGERARCYYALSAPEQCYYRGISPCPNFVTATRHRTRSKPLRGYRENGGPPEETVSPCVVSDACRFRRIDGRGRRRRSAFDVGTDRISEILRPKNRPYRRYLLAWSWRSL